MAKKKEPDQQRRLLNKKVKLSYHILEKVEAGIALKGSEVKSLRDGNASLDEAYARIDPQGVVLLNFQISPYSHAAVEMNHNPKRPKRLLLTKREIKKLSAKVLIRGQTLVPLALYFNAKGLAKVELALAKGKSKADRREDHKADTARRDIERAMRRGR